MPLPPSPAVVADVIERNSAIVRSKVTQVYEDLGITEYTEVARGTLSSLTVIHFLIQTFELWHIRKEVLPFKYAFDLPALPIINTKEYAVPLPDLFLLLTSSFWGPATLWTFTSILIPLFAAYFFNLTSKPRARSHSQHFAYTFDPLTFNVVKALLTFVIYGQDVTFGGLVDLEYVARINSALYGGWEGSMVGSGIGALVTIYEAIIKK